MQFCARPEKSVGGFLLRALSPYPARVAANRHSE
jgi:hypothetical protein